MPTVACAQQVDVGAVVTLFQRGNKKIISCRREAGEGGVMLDDDATTRPLTPLVWTVNSIDVLNADGWCNTYFIHIKANYIQLKSYPGMKDRVAIHVFPYEPQSDIDDSNCKEALALALMCAQAIEDALHVTDESEPPRRMRIMEQ